MSKPTKLTRGEIWRKVEAHESFWCQSIRERADAINYAKAIGANFTSGEDDRGGYYVIALTMPPMPAGTTAKTIATKKK